MKDIDMEHEEQFIEDMEEEEEEEGDDEELEIKNESENEDGDDDEDEDKHDHEEEDDDDDDDAEEDEEDEAASTTSKQKKAKKKKQADEEEEEAQQPATPLFRMFDSHTRNNLIHCDWRCGRKCRKEQMIPICTRTGKKDLFDSGEGPAVCTSASSSGPQSCYRKWTERASRFHTP